MSNAFVRNGLEPRFDLAISKFASKKVLLTVAASEDLDVRRGNSSTSVAITDVSLTLRQLIVGAGIPVANDRIQVATLIRGGKTYRMTFDYVFRPTTPEVDLTGGDHISINFFSYKQPQGYHVGAIDNPTAFPISPERRENLADILFVRGGVFDTESSRNSEIYLLRGTNPVKALQLNARNPARVRIAAELELRPNDVVFVTEKPVYSLSRTIRVLLPVNLARRTVEQTTE